MPLIFIVVITGSIHQIFLYILTDLLPPQIVFIINSFFCLSVGYYGNIYLLTDHFLDLYRQSSAYRKQAAMVLNEIVRGAAGIDLAIKGQGSEGEHLAPPTQEDLKASVVTVIEEYTSFNNWHLITVSEETDGDQQDQQVRKNVMYT